MGLTEDFGGGETEAAGLSLLSCILTDKILSELAFRDLSIQPCP